MRNRQMQNGEEWLTDECKTFFQSKLYQSNQEYSKTRKRMYSIAYPIRMLIWFFNDGKNNISRVKKHIRRKMRWKKNGTE